MLFRSPHFFLGKGVYSSFKLYTRASLFCLSYIRPGIATIYHVSTRDGAVDVTVVNEDGGFLGDAWCRLWPQTNVEYG